MRYLKFILSLSLITIFSSAYLFAMEEKDESEIKHARSRILNKEIKVKPYPIHYENDKFLVAIDPEYRRGGEGFIYVKLDNNYITVPVQSTIVTHSLDVSKFEKGKTWNLAEGIAGIQEHYDYFYSDGDVRLSCKRRISWENCFLDIKGSCHFIGKDLSFKGVLIWPIGNLVFKTDSKKCPIKKLTIVPSNNQNPTLVDGHIILNKDPLVDLECLNVASITLVFKH